MKVRIIVESGLSSSLAQRPLVADRCRSRTTELNRTGLFNDYPAQGLAVHIEDAPGRISDLARRWRVMASCHGQAIILVEWQPVG